MQINDIVEKYMIANYSFKKVAICHIGIDAGFFCEYSYMLEKCYIAQNIKYNLNYIPKMLILDMKKGGRLF